jgi:hypothetical protein
MTEYYAIDLIIEIIICNLIPFNYILLFIACTYLIVSS